MPNDPPNCPMTRAQVIDRYFMEHRAKLLDVAAFLDRVDRAAPPADGSRPADEPEDARMPAMRDAIGLLLDGRGERARRMLDLFSDPTADPIPAAGGKGAIGVWPRRRHQPQTTQPGK